jgi:hypothetical protein
VKDLRSAQKSINFQEEYYKVLRSRSYVDFFNKSQLLSNQPTIYPNKNIYSEILLEPSQENTTSIVESSILSKKPKLKKLMLNYFEVSAEASHICGDLLKSIKQVKYNHKYLQRTLEIMDYDDFQDKFDQIIFELDSFIITKNPFSNHKNNVFKCISDNHSSLLNHLKLMRKRVARKIKIMKFLKKGCSLLALFMVPTIFLGEIHAQIIDIAAKGTYILNRDLDTLSRLVTKLHDEVEHNKEMVQFCLERKYDRFTTLQIVREFIKSENGFRQQVEELEEHAYLCLLTINRARGLVIKEMTKTFSIGHGL